MGRVAQLGMVSVIGVAVAAYWAVSRAYGGNREELLQSFKVLSTKLGVWALPVYVATHTLAIAMCFPYSVAFEAGAAVFFGFAKGVACVFIAKVMGAALAFGSGRSLFRSSASACNFVRTNKYFNVLNKGVARDGWKFVLLARFSPIPSYIINYGLAATDVRFFVDFLLPTLAGGIPMILQNASLGTLTTIAAGDRSKKSVLSFSLPLLGIISGVLISWRIKKYVAQELTPCKDLILKAKKQCKADEMQKPSLTESGRHFTAGNPQL